MVKWYILIVFWSSTIIAYHYDVICAVVRCSGPHWNTALVSNWRVMWNSGEAIRCNCYISNSLVWRPFSELFHRSGLIKPINHTSIEIFFELYELNILLKSQLEAFIIFVFKAQQQKVNKYIDSRKHISCLLDRNDQQRRDRKKRVKLSQSQTQ